MRKGLKSLVWFGESFYKDRLTFGFLFFRWWGNNGNVLTNKRSGALSEISYFYRPLWPVTVWLWGRQRDAVLVADSQAFATYWAHLITLAEMCLVSVFISANCIGFILSCKTTFFTTHSLLFCFSYSTATCFFDHNRFREIYLLWTGIKFLSVEIVPRFSSSQFTACSTSLSLVLFWVFNHFVRFESSSQNILCVLTKCVGPQHFQK